MNVRLWLRLGAALGVIVAAVTIPALLTSAGSVPPPVPLKVVHEDPFEDGLGYHGSEEEPSIFAAANPARAGDLAGSSTIIATQQTGRVFDGGASSIGYEISVDGGKSWKQGELPLTMQSGVADTCAGPLNRASDTVTVYDKKHDVWIISTLGLSGNADVPAVYVNRGIVDFDKKSIDWGPPICQHITQPNSDSPDKNWITCDNWPQSKGYGNCYVEYDNNGNGNRILMQVTHDSGLTWEPGPNLNTNTVPGNGNTGDVANQTTLSVAAASGATNVKVASVTNIGTTLSAAAAAGATNIKVASVARFVATTLSAAAAAGDTNIKVASVQNLNAGQTLNIDSGAALESRVIQSVGTAGAAGTGITLTTGLGSAHASAALVTLAGQPVNVDTGANLETRTVLTVGTAGAAGTGVTLASALTLAHASGAQVNTRMNVDVDSSGGNQETVLVTLVGTAGAAGTGVDFTPTLTKSHVLGAPVANAAATQAGRTGGIGGVPLVQSPPPGAAPGTVCGRVVVPLSVSGVSYFSSNDCGEHWSASTQILPNMTAGHGVPNIRTSLLATSALGGDGAIYLVWQTRSFREGSVASTPNDIAMTVMAAPTDAQPNPPFGPPARIPIEADNTNANTNDHFIPGIAADPNTSGDSQHLALFYYNFDYHAPGGTCTYLNPENVDNQCVLRVGYVSSTDAGETWSDPLYLANMVMPDLVRSSQGLMVGDYSTADVIPAGPNKGNAISAVAIGLTDKTLNQPLFIPRDGIPIPFSPGKHKKQKPSKAAIERAEEEGVQPAPDVPPSVP